MAGLMIARSEVEANCPWPPGTALQGSAPWMQSRRFVEVSVPVGEYSTFMHVPGDSVSEAEATAFRLFERFRACAEHIFERGDYRNGAATCAACGMWASSVFEPLERCVECSAATFHYSFEGRFWCEQHARVAPKPWWYDDLDAVDPDAVAALLPEVLMSLATKREGDGPS